MSKVNETIEVEALETYIEESDGGVRLTGDDTDGKSPVLDVDSEEGEHDGPQISVFAIVEHAGDVIEVASYFTVGDEPTARALAAAITKPWDED